MATYKVSFEIELPDGAPFTEVEQFIEFELGARGSMLLHHEDLKRTDLQSCKVSRVWVDQAERCR